MISSHRKLLRRSLLCIFISALQRQMTPIPLNLFAVLSNSGGISQSISCDKKYQFYRSWKDPESARIVRAFRNCMYKHLGQSLKISIQLCGTTTCVFPILGHAVWPSSLWNSEVRRTSRLIHFDLFKYCD